MKNTPIPTKQVLALNEALQKRGIKVELEHWDGHKHVDMYIGDAQMYIEIDGIQHYTDPKQFAADLKRDHYSDDSNFVTKHISNQLVETHLDEIADAITHVAKERAKDLRIKTTEKEKKILLDFYARRALFDQYLKDNNISDFTCPCCGYPTLGERGGYEICNVCFWEDDGQDDIDADETWGGPNGSMSLSDGRLQIGETLNRLAVELHGTINLVPTDVINIINSLHERDKKLIAFRKERITMDTNINDPVWDEYKKLREDTLEVLIKR